MVKNKQLTMVILIIIVALVIWVAPKTGLLFLKYSVKIIAAVFKGLAKLAKMLAGAL